MQERIKTYRVKIEDAVPVFRTVQDHLNLLGQLLGLHQRENLEHLVERAETSTEPVLILVVGSLALVATFAYSGGPRPYAGLGLGEVMVFLFFGLMATCGTAFVMEERVPAAAWWCGSDRRSRRRIRC